MKKITTSLVIGIICGILAMIFFKKEPLDGNAVIVGQEHIGKIIGYTDCNHVFVSTNGDLIPEFVVKSDEQLFCEIEFQSKENTLANIEVGVCSINGSDFVFSKYKYLDKNITVHPVHITALARAKDNLVVIKDIFHEVDQDSSFIEKRKVTLAHYEIIQDRY